MNTELINELREALVAVTDRLEGYIGVEKYIDPDDEVDQLTKQLIADARAVIAKATT